MSAAKDKFAEKNRRMSRVYTALRASRGYGDGLHETLETDIKSKNVVTVYYNENCVSGYTSSANRKCASQLVDVPKRKLRTSYCDVDVKKHCLFCGKECNLERDPEHSDMWRRT